MPQTYELALSEFAAAEPALDLSRLKSIGLVFDRTPVGVVILGRIGFEGTKGGG